MIDVLNLKDVVFMPPTSATNGATITGQTVDTLGYDSLRISVFATTSDVVSDKPSVLKLQEADVTNTSSFADVTAGVGGGTGGFTIPSAYTATTVNSYAVFTVDLRYRKRYLRLLVSPLTTQTYVAVGHLGRPEQAPITAATHGTGVVVAV